MKLAISGLIYPVTMMRYMWEELERFGNIELFSIGPFFGDWIPWRGGLTLPRQYVKTPNVPLSGAVNYHPQSLSDVIPDDIDVWLQVDASWHFASRPPAKKVVLIETDPHCIKDSYTVPASYSDVVLCMQSNYMVADDIWWPYAVDNHWFYPEDLPIKHDVCIIGLQYEQRTRVVNRMRQIGKNVLYDTGIIYDEYRNAYNSSRVAFNWSSLQDLPVRVFEAMGMKRPLVTNRVPDLEKLFIENEHYLGFSTVDEAEEKIKFLLDTPDFAHNMAEKAYKEVMKRHTWKTRLEQLFRIVDGEKSIQYI